MAIKLSNRNKQQTFKKVFDKLLTESSPFSVKEAYSSIRANLLFVSNGSECPTIAFTSASENSGKTLTCINLAISFTQMGKKVLIIDADMRNPSINRGLSVKNDLGLSEVLAGIITEIPIIKTKYENLYVLPAGKTPPNPAELLLSKRFDKLKTACEPNFDFIFIDTPPIGVVADALPLSKKIDGFVFIVRAGVENKHIVKDTIDEITMLEGKVLGMILNDVNNKTQGYKGNYGKYGYGYGYGYGKYTSKYHSEK